LSCNALRRLPSACRGKKVSLARAPWQARFNLALLLIQQGRHTEAEKELRWLESHAGDGSRVDVLYGRWHLTQGRSEEALTRFESAAGRDSSNPQQMRTAKDFTILRKDPIIDKKGDVARQEVI